MPCYVGSEDDINLAQYGSSNSGKMKTLYREGLKRRYGSLMQIISGVHFNFSFPESFWDQLYGQQDEQQRQESKSQAYFGLIRNYYRFGWLIPYSKTVISLFKILSYNQNIRTMPKPMD